MGVVLRKGRDRAQIEFLTGTNTSVLFFTSVMIKMKLRMWLSSLRFTKIRTILRELCPYKIKIPITGSSCSQIFLKIGVFKNFVIF